MNVIIREIRTDDWSAIYLNEKLVLEDHNIDIQYICEKLQDLIKYNGSITSIKGEYYYLSD